MLYVSNNSGTVLSVFNLQKVLYQHCFQKTFCPAEMIETIVDGVLDILFRTVHILPETGLNSVVRTTFPLQHHGSVGDGLC
jgi:hypothetical protein